MPLSIFVMQVASEQASYEDKNLTFAQKDVFNSRSESMVYISHDLLLRA
jgi:hypothetical protein